MAFLTFLLLFIATPLSAQASPFNVLVVMSYEQDNPWCKDIKDGIDKVLGQHARLTYFYMDTKARLSGGPAKAEQAFTLYEKLQPDGVITVDDNAQSMFVLPYLKDKTDTPVFFCGVNAEAQKYGYPNSHISGTLERGHIRESIAFAKQLLNRLDNMCFLAKASPSGEALKRQVNTEQHNYMATVKRFDLIKSAAELKQVGEQANRDCDAIYMDSLEGIIDANGKPLVNHEVQTTLAASFHGAILGANQYHVEDGALSAVVKTGHEQGETAAEMLLRALRGTPVAEIPVTRNYRGRRVINVSTMESLGIRPRPIVLRGATLVRSTENAR